MHVRLSTCLGTEVIDRSSGETLGLLSGLFVHPDTGKLEGVYVTVATAMFGSSQSLFCGSDDIVHWGATLQIRSHSCLSPLEDRVRLIPLHQEGRTIIGQHIRSEAGRSVGRCKDVQIDTEKMRLEWLFPRRFFQQGIAIPAKDIVEVRREAIIVRDALKAEEVRSCTEKSSSVFESFPEIAEARGSKLY
jgi:sporulation protein YlmC with PRC-barrel domain